MFISGEAHTSLIKAAAALPQLRRLCVPHAETGGDGATAALAAALIHGRPWPHLEVGPRFP